MITVYALKLNGKYWYFDRESGVDCWAECPTAFIFPNKARAEEIWDRLRASEIVEVYFR